MLRFFLVAMIFIVGCPMDKQASIETVDSQPKLSSELDTLRNIDWSELEVSADNTLDELTDENLFGKFYQDRIEFHIIDNPGDSLYTAKVEQITLYYIDGQLSRKKYLLDKDIADQLAIKFGGMTYRSLDQSTDSLAKEMGILIATSKGRKLNPYLKKYQLKWKLEDHIIYFQHLEDSLDTYNYFIEEMADYRQRYRSVQKDLL